MSETDRSVITMLAVELTVFAMARSSDPDSAGSQFYFCLGSQHGLDSGYTVFGKTLEGKAVIAELRAGDVLHSVRIETA